MPHPHLRSAAAGAAIGFAIPGMFLVPMALFRLVMPTTDGDWGEPLFYFVVLGAPLAAAGALLAALISIFSAKRE